MSRTKSKKFTRHVLR
ncbi:hypothetical protein [Porphyromonas gingivalis]|nr:hypothetical protein [Porphyromonas gingivalis]